MARASAKRGGRPRPNARRRAQREQPVAPAKEAPRRPAAGYESQLFFTRLRRRAKWVFAFLAVAFAIGFVVFGVGTGVSGGNVGDFLRDLFGGGGPGVPSVADALGEVEDNPNDPEALRDLANAYQAAQQTQDAAATLEKYVALRPDDADALRQLGNLYARLAALAQQRASSLLEGGGLGQSFSAELWSFPGTSGFLGAVGEDPIDQAVTVRRSASASEAGNEATRWIEKQVTVFERLAKAVPEDTTVLIQLAQAASSAGQTEKAVEAYQKYLEVDPTGPYAEAAKRQLENLQGINDVVTG